MNHKKLQFKIIKNRYYKPTDPFSIFMRAIVDDLDPFTIEYADLLEDNFISKQITDEIDKEIMKHIK